MNDGYSKHIIGFKIIQKEIR